MKAKEIVRVRADELRPGDEFADRFGTVVSARPSDDFPNKVEIRVTTGPDRRFNASTVVPVLRADNG